MKNTWSLWADTYYDEISVVRNIKKAGKFNFPDSKHVIEGAEEGDVFAFATDIVVVVVVLRLVKVFSAARRRKQQQAALVWKKPCMQEVCFLLDDKLYSKQRLGRQKKNVCKIKQVEKNAAVVL